jgi:hypothetical protein
MSILNNDLFPGSRSAGILGLSNLSLGFFCSVWGKRVVSCGSELQKSG